MVIETSTATGGALCRYARPDEIIVRNGTVVSHHECARCGADSSPPVNKVSTSFQCPECSGKLLLAGNGVSGPHGFSFGAVCRNCGMKLRWCGTRTLTNVPEER
jgi:DNA-directed RNA polymerase subunit RPC12/RpoP